MGFSFNSRTMLLHSINIGATPINSTILKNLHSFPFLSTIYWYMTTIPTTCHKCNTPFEMRKAEYDRQLRNGRNHFFCSRSCAQSCNKHTTFQIISTCLWCGKDFETTTHKKARACCSKECAVRFAQSKVNPEIHKQSVQRILHYPRRECFLCVVCGKKFEKSIRFENQKFQTCSDECYKLLLKKKAIENPNCGGETGYRHYKYKSVWMDSQWEVQLAKWMDDNGVRWERSRKLHMFWWTDKFGQKRRYYPDFYLPDYDVYLDPKNKYRMKMDREKLEAVVKENGIKLVCGLLEDVKKEIDILWKS